MKELSVEMFHLLIEKGRNKATYQPNRRKNHLTAWYKMATLELQWLVFAKFKGKVTRQACWEISIC